MIAVCVASALMIGAAAHGIARQEQMPIPWVEPLSNKTVREIVACFEKQGLSLHYDRETRQFDNVLYYGTFHGYVVLCRCFSIMHPVGYEMIAGYELMREAPFTMWAFKDGELWKLSDAYEKGLLAKRDIAKVAKRNERYLENRKKE